jgi:hypothetical protein
MLKAKSILALLLAAVLPAAAFAQDVKPPRQFLSIDYTTHATFGKAVKNSFAPTDFRANVGAVAKNTIEPLNPLRYVGSVVAIEVQKQLASGEGLDLKKVVSKLDPAGLTGGYIGAQAGEALGAIAQTALAKAVGPIGGTVGFALRPILWLAGSSIGGEVAKGVAKGEPGNPLKKGMATALRDFNPIIDSAQMIGDNVGGVLGQALIPVPFVGLLVGSAVGGVTGLLIGKAVTSTGPGKALDEHLRSALHGKADTLAPDIRGATPDGKVPLITGPGTDKQSSVRDPAPQRGFAPKVDAEPKRDAAPKRDPEPIRDPAAKRDAVAEAYKLLQDAIQAGEQKEIERRLKEYETVKDGGAIED